MSRIVKILRVVDTRTYEEGPDDRWYPIPGSGIINQCFRCGRDHEVHAEVLLDDGGVTIVGTTCARADETEIASKLKSGANTAKTIAKLKAALVKGQATVLRWRADLEEVKKIPLPPIIEEPNPEGERHPLLGVSHWYHMGDSKVRSNDLRKVDEERMRCLVNGWIDNRMKERGWKYPPDFLRTEGDILRRLAKAEQRLAQATA